MTLVELLVFIGTVGCAIFGATTAAKWLGWIGYPVGFVCGAALVPGLLYMLGTLYDLVWWGRPPRPACRNGKCQSDDYEFRQVGEHEFDWFCRCGFRYRKQSRRFYEVHTDGTLARYMIWRPFRGWFQDGPE
jgi:hypothetical protein